MYLRPYVMWPPVNVSHSSNDGVSGKMFSRMLKWPLMVRREIVFCSSGHDQNNQGAAQPRFWPVPGPFWARVGVRDGDRDRVSFLVRMGLQQYLRIPLGISSPH